MPDDELRRLAATGRLTDIPGVGEKTAVVIAEALNGDTPAYLTKLLGEIPELGTDAGEALRAHLKGDLHSHSDWSDGGDTIEAMATKARDLGHEYLALTDHSPRLKIANGLSADRLREQLEVVDALNRELAPFRILTGVECDILEDGALDQHEELLARVDVVVASVHSKLRMEADLDDAPDGGRGREPARRRARALHRPAPRGQGPAGVDVRRRRDHRGLPPVRHRDRDQLPARTTRSAQADPHARRSRPACASRSAPTPTRSSSSNGSPTAPTAAPRAV